MQKTYYKETLNIELSNTLENISQHKSTSRFQELNPLVGKLKGSNNEINYRIDTLESYHYIKLADSWPYTETYPSRKNSFTGSKKLVGILDYPIISVQHGSVVNENQFSNEGFVVEDITHCWVGQYLMTKYYCTNPTVIEYEFMEPSTEVDEVVIDYTERKIFWGSCKRNFGKQNFWNLVAHIFSFFNNRGFMKSDYYHYKHYLMFIAPVIDPDISESKIEFFKNEFSKLLEGEVPLQNFIDEANKLSEYYEGKKEKFALLPMDDTSEHITSFDIVFEDILFISLKEMLETLQQIT